MKIDNFLEDNKQQDINFALRKGATGNSVIILQDKLKTLGYYPLSITGSYDVYTNQAVIEFQKDHELTTTGIVDNDTWQMLYGLTTNPEQLLVAIETKPTLRLGSTGPYVTELQTLLTNLLYYNGVIDGIFGSSTENAVKRFQVNNNLTADGIVGRDTWSALSSLYSPMAICNGNDTENIVYTVVAGDTLWAIARRFNTTVEAIKILNNLTSDRLNIGQQLLIPTGEQNTVTYTVVAGDNLWALAQRFNTTIEDIKKLNNLTSDRLSIGQQLLIPANTRSIIPFPLMPIIPFRYITNNLL